MKQSIVLSILMTVNLASEENYKQIIRSSHTGIILHTHLKCET